MKSKLLMLALALTTSVAISANAADSTSEDIRNNPNGVSTGTGIISAETQAKLDKEGAVKSSATVDSKSKSTKAEKHDNAASGNSTVITHDGPEGSKKNDIEHTGKPSSMKNTSDNHI